MNKKDRVLFFFNIFAALIIFLGVVSISPEALAGTSEQETAPFFKALQDYVARNEDPWSTPGHQAGVGLLKAEPGRSFYRFFGGNIFKADVSSSMSELGSILGHSGAVKEAEDNAARAFGADKTFFVTNGTSTSNKIVFHSAVSSGDIVLADRNCHKSTMHAIIMTRAIPLYLHPTRNAYGIIGPIPNSEFTQEAIDKKRKDSPFLTGDGKSLRPKLVVVTNSTYDGLCYDAAAIKETMADKVDNIHFDEAWYAYAKFHPIYHGRFAMEPGAPGKEYPPIFATQSTHKMLTAFSMGSMIHIKDGTDKKIDPEIFNEAWLMHTTTSPFYPMVASLDVASKMMELSGRSIVDDMLEQALWFRKKMTVRYKKEILKERGGQKGWWFKIWQPETVTLDKEGSVKKVDLENVDNAILANDADIWVLKPGDKWHGFDIPQGESILLDPVKVTVLTPGINEEGVLLDDGIPAPVVARFLMDDLIIPEKVGFYNLLFLFSSGVTKAKSQRLINGFAEFKRLYEANAALEKVFPELVKEFPDKYKNLGLRDLCRDMHGFFKSEDILALMRQTYLVVQPQAMLPADAYEHIVRGNVEYVPLDKLQGRTSAVILAPYPPGIPVVMPGEKFTPQTRKIIDYFIMTEEIDNRFPGFEIEIHGMNVKNVSGKNTCYVLCVK